MAMLMAARQFASCVSAFCIFVDHECGCECLSTLLTMPHPSFGLQVKIMRSSERVDGNGLGRSKGYGFVEFSNHDAALNAVRNINNNPDIFGDLKVRVYPHRAIVNILQPSSTQCDVGPVCVPIELLSTCLIPVWCWFSVCPHRAIVNLLQPASTQCGVGPVCVPIKLLSTCLNPVWCWFSVCPHRAIVNLPQPSVVLVQCVSP